MKNQSLIHIRLERGEALEAKRSLLLSEENLLEAIKSMEKYQFLRKRELKLKSGLSKNVNGISSSLKKLESIFPRLAGTPAAKKTKRITEEKTEKYDRDLESELNQIKEKLRAISR